MITSKMEFDNTSSVLCARMVSQNRETRTQAAKDAFELVADLPKFLRNSPHCKAELEALNTLIASNV